MSIRTRRFGLAAAAIGTTVVMLTSGPSGATTTPPVVTYGATYYQNYSAPNYDGVSTDLTYTPDTQRTATGTTTPLLGDFNHDGLQDVFWYGTGTVSDSLWLAKPYYEGNVGGTANPTSRFTEVPYTVGGTYVPFAGDFDGDGYTDIFWYAPGTAADSIWYFGPGGSITSVDTNVTGRYQPVVGDFDQNDGVPSDDIFWYGQDSAESVWSGRSTRIFQMRSFSVAAPQGAQVLKGNFVTDGARTGTATHQHSYFPDLFFYVPGSGQDALWASDGAGNFTVTDKTVNGRYTPIVGTFHTTEAGWTGGLTDIFWYTAGTGADTVWMSQGNTNFNAFGLNVNGTYKPFIIPGMVGSDAIVWNNPAGYDAVWIPTGTVGSWNYQSASFPGADMGTREPLVGYFDDYVDSNDALYIAAESSQVGRDSVVTPNVGSTTTSTTTVTSYNSVVSELPRADVLWWAPGNTAGVSDEKEWRLNGSRATFVTPVYTSGP